MRPLHFSATSPDKLAPWGGKKDEADHDIHFGRRGNTAGVSPPARAALLKPVAILKTPTSQRPSPFAAPQCHGAAFFLKQKVVVK